jgi:hypothetical protein
MLISLNRPMLPLLRRGFRFKVTQNLHLNYFHQSVSKKTMAPTPWIRNQYPAARRSDAVGHYKSESRGQIEIHDPYQWLEENTDETDKWTTAQEAFTRAYLDQNTDRQKLEDEIRSNMDYVKVL